MRREDDGMGVPAGDETAARVRGLDAVQRRLFTCSLAERVLPLLLGHAEDRGLAATAAVARRWLDACWDAATSGRVAPVARPDELVLLWPWWDGPAAFASKMSLDVLDAAAEVVATPDPAPDPVGLGASGSVMLAMAQMTVEVGPALDEAEVVERERRDRTADLETLEEADDPVVVGGVLRATSATRGVELADLARRLGMSDQTHPRPEYVQPERSMLVAGVEAALAGVSDVDWGASFHAYGPARGVDTLLFNRGTADPERADSAAVELWGSICHQGDIYDATALALPFVLRLAGVAGVHKRAVLVGLAACAAAPYHHSEALDRVHGAVRTASPELIDLLGDDDQSVVVCSAAIVAGLPDPPAMVVSALSTLEARVRHSNHVAAVALARWATGLEADRHSVWQAVRKTEEWLEMPLTHLRAALDTDQTPGVRARNDIVEACTHLSMA